MGFIPQQWSLNQRDASACTGTVSGEHDSSLWDDGCCDACGLFLETYKDLKGA
jgi:hypothetical protein